MGRPILQDGRHTIITNSIFYKSIDIGIKNRDLGAMHVYLTSWLPNLIRVWHELVLREHHKACRRSYISLSGPTRPSFSGLVHRPMSQ